jgi:hypothetical protein
MGEMKGITMKTLRIFELLCLLSIVAYSQISVAVSGAGEPPATTRDSSSVAAPPSPLKLPVGAIARDESGRGSRDPIRSTAAPEAGARDNDGGAATDLSAYVYLHETRNASNFVQVYARARMCPE